MATIRTMAQSKADLIASADTLGSFGATYDRTPTEVSSSLYPIFLVVEDVDFLEIQEIDPHEVRYDGRWEFRVVMVFDSDDTEASVITTRNAFMTQLDDDVRAASTLPFRLTSLSHFISHWTEREVWIVDMRLTRYTQEDFN